MERNEVLELLKANSKAVMITIGRDGTPHSVPVLYGLDGESILISGTHGRARTRNVERDPRCLVTVFDQGNWFKYVTIVGECTVRGGDPVADNERLYEMITGKKPDDLDEYREQMTKEKRLVYEVSIERWY